MKRWLGCFFAALLLFSVASALADSQDRSPLAIDMVVIIDHSTQMVDADKDGMRFDAAAALISMCDTQYSKATYFMFSHSLMQFDEIRGAGSGGFYTVSASDLTLFDISLPKNKNARSNILDKLNGKNIHKVNNTRKDQVVGRALNAAVNLLTNSSNKNDGNRKVIVMLTSALGQATDDEMKNAKKARDKAVKNGVEIYTVVVGSSSGSANAKALATNGHYQVATTAKELPNVFNIFYADMIQSEASKSTGKKKNDGSYEVTIDVPNKSVAEINVILPVSDVDSYALKDPKGAKVSPDNKGEFFATYKLLDPANGKWTLTYSSKSKNSVSVQYIFSYDIEVQASTDKAVYSKHEPVTVTSQYVEDGMPTKDELLYAIPATITLKKGDTVIASDAKMQGSKDSKSYTICFSDLMQYGAGTYEYSIHYAGQGMIRDLEGGTFELVDDAPALIDKAKSGERVEKTIDIPGDAASYEIQTLPAISLPSYVTDLNGDKITYEIASCTAEVDAVINDADELVIQTRKDTGTAGTLVVRTKDSDGAQGPDLRFDIEIEDLEERYADHTVSFSASKDVRKNSRFTIELTIKDSNSMTVSNDQYLPAEVPIEVTDTRTQTTKPLTLTRSGSVWTGEWETADVETTYELNTTVSIGQIRLTADAYQVTAADRAPELIDAKKTGDSWNVTINDPKDDASYEVQSKSWDLTDYITDPDGDALTFTVGSKGEGVTAAIDGTELKIDTVKDTAASADVVIAVTDNDGTAGPELTFHAEVTNYESRYRTYTAQFNTIDRAQKNSEYDLTLTIMDAAGTIVTNDDRLPEEVQADITDHSGNKEAITLRRADGKWTGKLTTGDGEDELTLNARIKIGQVTVDADTRTIKIGNLAPEMIEGAKDHDSHEFTINDPQDAASYEQQKYTWDLNEFITDPNGDDVTFTVKDTTADVDADIVRDCLEITTRRNTPTMGTVTVSSADNDGMAGPELTFTITVSDYGVRYDGYKAVLTCAGNDKNTELDLTLTVYDSNDIKVTGDENMPGTIDAIVTRGQDQSHVTLTRADDGAWTGKLPVSDLTDTYQVDVTVDVGKEVHLTAPALVITTEDKAPEVVKEIGTAVPAEISIDPFLLWSNATGPVTMDLNEYFTDPDGDALTYEVIGGDGCAKVDGSTLTVDASGSAVKSATFSVKATDTEEKSVTGSEVTFTIVSLKNKGLTIIAIVAAAIVVLLIVIQMVKPHYPRARFEAKVDNMTYGEGQNLPSSGSMKKKAVPMANYVPSLAQSACGATIQSQLRKAVLKPAYGGIKVDASKMNGVQVRIGTTAGAKGTVGVNGTIMLTADQKTLELKLVKIAQPGQKAPGAGSAPASARRTATPVKPSSEAPRSRT